MVPAKEVMDTTLIVLAWRRQDYLYQCLESWGHVRGAEDLLHVTVRLGRSDPGMQTAMAELAQEFGRRYRLPLRVVLDDPEDAQIKGPDRALGKEINASFNDPACSYVIECDEDIVVSDDILEYFTWSRGHMDTACAHNALGQGWLPWHDDSNAAQDTVQLMNEFTSWCFGFSRFAWENVWQPVWDWDRTSGDDPKQHGWEWAMHRYANAGAAILVPDASRCQNIGEHGGTFSLPGDFAGTISKSFREHREPVMYRVV